MSQGRKPKEKYQGIVVRKYLLPVWLSVFKLSMDIAFDESPHDEAPHHEAPPHGLDIAVGSSDDEPNPPRDLGGQTKYMK